MRLFSIDARYVPHPSIGYEVQTVPENNVYDELNGFWSTWNPPRLPVRPEYGLEGDERINTESYHHLGERVRPLVAAPLVEVNGEILAEAWGMVGRPYMNPYWASNGGISLADMEHGVFAEYLYSPNLVVMMRALRVQLDAWRYAGAYQQTAEGLLAMEPFIISLLKNNETIVGAMATNTVISMYLTEVDELLMYQSEVDRDTLSQLDAVLAQIEAEGMDMYRRALLVDRYLAQEAVSSIASLSKEELDMEESQWYGALLGSPVEWVFPLSSYLFQTNKTKQLVDGFYVDLLALPYESCDIESFGSEMERIANRYFPDSEDWVSEIRPNSLGETFSQGMVTRLTPEKFCAVRTHATDLRSGISL